jgi:hypothetical protein
LVASAEVSALAKRVGSKGFVSVEINAAEVGRWHRNGQAQPAGKLAWHATWNRFGKRRTAARVVVQAA